MAHLEHANITVSDAAATAAWLGEVFGWHLRWEGGSKNGGHSKHVGNATSYVALYQPPGAVVENSASDHAKAWLNHLAVVVSDLDATEIRVKAAGFTPCNHGDYEPGRRFYFEDADGVEWEVVQYDT